MSPIDEQTALLSHSRTASAKASRVRWTLLAVWGSNLTFALSASAVGTLAPLISGSFDRVELGSYIGSLFSFSSVLATPLFGALAGPSASASASAGSGALSRRACLLLAGALFAAGQTICALAPDMGTFLLGRAIGGLGGAGILCLSSLITTDLISLRERGMYQGYMMSIFSLGAALGGPLAGFLASPAVFASWRPAILIPTLPILAASLVAVGWLLPGASAAAGQEREEEAGDSTSTAAVFDDVPPSAKSKGSPSSGIDGLRSALARLAQAVDLPGLGLLGTTVGSLLWGLSVKASPRHLPASAPSRGGGPTSLSHHAVASGAVAVSPGWSDPSVLRPLLTALLALIALVLVERRAERKGQTRALIPLRAVMQRNVFWTSVSCFLICIANGACLFNLPLFYTLVLDLSPTEVGLRLLPQALTLGFGSLGSGAVIRRTGSFRTLGLVSLCLPIGSAWAMSRWSGRREGGGTWHEWVDPAPAGLGYSAFLVTSLMAILASVPKADIPKATALSYLFRTLGTTLGVALSAAFQQAVLASELSKRFTGPGAEAMIASIIRSKTYLLSLPPLERASAVEAYALSLKSTFKAMALVGVLALVAAWPIEERALGLAGERVGGGGDHEDDPPTLAADTGPVREAEADAAATVAVTSAVPAVGVSGVVGVPSAAVAAGLGSKTAGAGAGYGSFRAADPGR